MIVEEELFVPFTLLKGAIEEIIGEFQRPGFPGVGFARNRPSIAHCTRISR